ncbi:hypothetical protein OC845_004395 [Tilletia horrida]|nr:hypothetical protein OC845_004395 [Tilletia horrida]
MRLSSWLLGFAATSLAGVAAAPPQNNLEARGEIHDIMHIIEKQKCGEDFCSTFIHLPPHKTTTKTVTKTVFNTVPSSTKVQTSVFTQTGPAITQTSTNVVTVKITPTVSATVAVPIPSTSTVTTITSVVTATEAVTQTVTSFTQPPTRRRKSGERIPSWLHGHCSASISKACSNLFHPKTCTKTKTITTTKTVSSGVSTINKSTSVTVTPTKTAVVTVSETATVSPPITSTVTISTSSLVPVTATDVETTVVTVTATQTVTLPSPGPVTATGRIKVVTSDGNDSGYLGPVRGGFGTTTVVGSSADAIQVSFLAGASGPVNILITNPDTSHQYLGAVFGQNGNSPDLKANSGNRYLNMGEVDKVTAGTQSASDNGSSLNDNGLGGNYESQIWNYNPATQAFSIVWTNSDGSQAVNPSLVNVDLGIQFLEWTYDTDTFVNSYSGTEVNLVFEKTP